MLSQFASEQRRQLFSPLRRVCIIIIIVYFILTGFIYVGHDSEIPIDLKTTFRPEVGIEVFEGVIDLEVSVPSGPKWDAFRHNVIDEFQKPEFDDWPHVGPNASIEVISTYAGKAD